MSDGGRNGGAVWKTLAIALLSALLSGSGVLVLGAVKRQPPPELQPLESRVAVEEAKSLAVEQRLTRIESKQDQIIELLNRRSR